MRLSRLLIPMFALLAACSGHPSKGSAQQVQGGFPAPERQVPRDANIMRLSFAPVVKKASPAVVNVYSRSIVRQQVDPFWQMFGLGGVPRERVQQSLGSGSIVRADGIIITNNHVIAGGQEIMVALQDRRQFPAKVLLADPHSDLAVLKIDPKGEKLPVIAIDDRSDVEIGDLVLAIGNPFGVGQTVTNGIVSALARTDVGASDYSYYIQTDAPINPGNSGGPLVDMNGDMIGVNSAILSRTGTSTGVGFAIPAAIVRQVLDTALRGGRTVVRPWLGVRAQAVTPDIASSLGLSAPAGVIVSEVYPGSAADRAGIKPRDIILSVNGEAVNDDAALNYRIGSHNPGDEMTLQVRSGSRPAHAVQVRAEPPPAIPAKDERLIHGRNPFGGATVLNVSPAVAQDLGLDPFTARGVIVSEAPAGSVASQAGLQPGDVVKAVNGRPIRSTSELQAALAGGGDAWRIIIQRGDQEITGDFTL
jgi:Do/DeqQ family serine protease